MITREDLVVKSVTDYAKNQIRDWGYDENVWEWRERFDAEEMDPFTKSVIGAGFDFTDQGRAAEMGSNLKLRTYHIEFAVFGHSFDLGRNISGALVEAIEQDGCIPVIDYGDDARPVLHAMEVLGVANNRAELADPQPWEAFLWIVSAQVEDCYLPRVP